jgi:hypothetical protein
MNGTVKSIPLFTKWSSLILQTHIRHFRTLVQRREKIGELDGAKSRILVRYHSYSL